MSLYKGTPWPSLGLWDTSLGEGTLATRSRRGDRMRPGRRMCFYWEAQEKAAPRWGAVAVGAQAQSSEARFLQTLDGSCPCHLSLMPHPAGPEASELVA